MSTDAQQHGNKDKNKTPAGNGVGTAAPKAAAPKKAKAAPTPKDVFVVFGTAGAQTMKTFKQVAKLDGEGNPAKNEKGEAQFISAKKQAEDFVNSSDAPEGPLTIIVGNAKRTKQRL